MVQCCGVVEVDCALGCRKRTVTVKEVKESRGGRGFCNGKNSSEAITCLCCLFNVDLLPFADGIKLGEQVTGLKAGLLFRGPQTGALWNPARTNTSSCPSKEEWWQESSFAWHSSPHPESNIPFCGWDENLA